MEKPKTKLEKTACNEARREAIVELVRKKKEEYAVEMTRFISEEKQARAHQKIADELREILGVTDKEMKELFE